MFNFINIKLYYLNLLISLNEDVIDDILYIQDILSLNVGKINYCLINCVYYYLLLPVCINSLITRGEVKIK